MEEDYYKLLGVNYNATIEEINNVYNDKIKKYKNLPFLMENDKINIKKYKKAMFIFNNEKFKTIYDTNLLFVNRINLEKETIKKNNNRTYISNRIFSLVPSNEKNIEEENILRPNIKSKYL
jgi:DnaJ-class molecular chaperone